MNDSEMLELAAKAAGVSWEGVLRDGGVFVHEGRQWDPLTDDGDALRLAVKLGISIEPYPIYNEVKHSVITKQRRRSDQLREANPTESIELYGDDPDAATRRAIVHAAAKIEKETTCPTN